MKSILDYIKVFKNIETYKGPGPGTMAQGGRIGFKVGSPQSMLLQYGVKKAILPALEAMGVTLSAARLAEIATENPTALNKIAAYVASIPGKLEEADAQTKTAFKEWVSNFIPEVHGGKGPIPADPPETFPAEDTWDKSFKDEGLTIPTEEKIKVPDSIPPQIKTEPEGFPIPEQKGWQDYVLYKKKVEEDLHAQAHKNRKKIVVSGRDRTAEYAENHKGFYKKQNLPKLKDTLSISEKTTEIKFKPEIVEERIKNLKDQKIIKLNDNLTAEEFMDAIGATYDKKSSGLLRKIGAVPIVTESGRIKFNFKDTYQKLLDFSKGKGLSGRKKTEYEIQLIEDAGFVNKQSNRRKKFEQALDLPRYKLLLARRNTRSNIMKEIGVEDKYENRANEVDHGPYPIDLIMDKGFDKKFRDKFLSMQNETLKSKALNQALMKKQGAFNSVLDIYKKNLNKTMKTKDQINEIKEARDKEEKIYKSLEELADEMGETGKIVKTTVRIPKIGEKFTIDNIEVDMSGVKTEFIVGNVNFINPKANKLKDLDKDQKQEYLNNLMAQDVKELSDFYSSLTDDNGDRVFSDIEIKEMIEEYRDGMFSDVSGIEGRKFSGIKYATGGPVELDFSLPEEFAGGGMVGIRRPSALPPTGGPMSQGLRSLYNNDRKW